MADEDRKYYAIWKQLKETGRATVAAPKPFHRRIIRAVSKEKYQDLVWQFEMSEAGTRKKLAYSTNASMIRFKLVSHGILASL